jgi:3-oxoacyl-[acyl-carrier protein] reductase
VRLEGKVAIVTGAGRGIGKAYAARYLDEGARVAVADIGKDEGEAALEELSARGEAIFVPTDVADEESVEACVRHTVDRFGTVDVLLNNAALFGDLDKTDHSLGYLKKVFDVNLHGAWLMTRAAAPPMVDQGRGRVIMQASDAAYIYAPDRFEAPTYEGLNSFGYNQTKWGIVGLTKFLAVQLGQYGITVNCISPGPVLTDAMKEDLDPARIEELRRKAALHRTLEPEDLTGAAVFFASDDAAMITGQVLCVDAGLCMPA